MGWRGDVKMVMLEQDILVNFAAIVTIAVPFIALIIYVASRRIASEFYGINKLYVSPPFVSAPMATEVNGGFTHGDVSQSYEPDSTSKISGDQAEGYVENGADLKSPVVICIPCTLVNTDIFPETLTNVRLSITHVETGKEFHFAAMKISQDLEITDDDGKLKRASYFEEQILSRGQEKRFNFFFFARPPLKNHIEEAKLGGLQIGKYKLKLEFEKKKFCTTIEPVSMEFEITKFMHDSIWNQEDPTTVILLKGEDLTTLDQK